MLAALLGAACGAGAAHVVKFGSIGIARLVQQPLATFDEDGKGGGEEGDQHGSLSICFAENGAERHGEDLVAKVVAGVQRPAAPVFS